MTINDQTRLSSVLYWSGGSGGGTGTYGSVSRNQQLRVINGGQVHRGCGIGTTKLNRTSSNVDSAWS